MDDKTLAVNKLNCENVTKIFKDCLFKSNEIERGIPISNFVIAEGIRSNVVFNAERLNNHKSEIEKLISMLYRIDEGEFFLNLCFDRDGNQWADTHQVMEQIVQLGIACDLLRYPLKKEFWGNLPGGMPYVIKSNSKDNKPLIGKSPSEFPKQKIKNNQNHVAKKVSTEAEQKAKIEKITLENFSSQLENIKPIFSMLGFHINLENSKIIVRDENGQNIGQMDIENTFGFHTEVNISTKKGKLTHIYVIDGKSQDGGVISRNIIRLDSLEEINVDENHKKYNGRYIEIELGTGQTVRSDIPRIEVKVIDPNAENIITGFSANSYSFQVDLENAFGPWGNYINGTHRSVSFEDSSKTPYIPGTTFMSYESLYNGNSYYITLDGVTIKTTSFIDGNSAVSNLESTINRLKINEISRQLLTAPRTKNLIDYVINSLNNTIPGIKEYIITSPTLMNDVYQLINTSKEVTNVSEEILNLFMKCHIEECDLPNDKSIQKHI